MGKRIGIVVFWVLIISQLSLAGQWEQYYAVYIQGQRGGWAFRSRHLQDGQVTSVERVVMEIARAGISIGTEVTETSVETTDGRAVAFEAVEKISAMESVVRGRVSDGVAEVVTTSFGRERKQQMDWPGGAIMAEGLRLAVANTDLEPGSVVDVKLFSAQLTAAVDARIEIVGTEQVALPGGIMELTRVTNTLNIPGAGQMTTTSYLNDDIVSMKDVMSMMGMQIELVASSKEYALAESDAPEIFLDSTVASPVRIDVDADWITYVLRGRDEADIQKMDFPTDDNQSYSTDSPGRVKLTVHPAAWPEMGSFEAEEGFEKYLQPGRYVQSDDPRIIELAGQAVGDTEDAVEALGRIEKFAAEYITNPTWTVGYASASEVAQNRSGDCTEYAVLAAALCRAAGIPAEVVMGIVYVDDYGGIDQAFAGHAWVRAYVQGRWVGIDPAFVAAGLDGYGPGHIALSLGGDDPQSFLELMPIMGNLELVEVEYGD